MCICLVVDGAQQLCVGDGEMTEKTMRLLTAGLKTVQLDWALAKTLGLNPQIKLNTVWVQKRANGVPFDGATPLNHVNPALFAWLSREHRIELIAGDSWTAKSRDVGSESSYIVADGKTRAEAVARCVCLMHFGEWVDMPIELCSMDVL